MNVITPPVLIPPVLPLAAELARHIGRHTDKAFDWDAFPSNRGFPELARAQMRYIGAGGSPKAGDPSTLKPEHFTLSMIFQQPGTYAACHAHEIEEAFLVLSGVLTVGWKQGDEVVEVRLGPGDMILNAREVPHGFRNEGVEPVLMSIMVGVGKPLPPHYVAHPKNTDADLARRFGAAEGHTIRFDANDPQPLQQLMARHLIRARAQPLRWEGGIGRKVYVGEGGVPAATARKEMLSIPRGAGVQPYARDTEEALLVLDGTLTVGWEQDGVTAEQQLGPRDLLLTPPGRRHWFRNQDGGDARAWLVVGGAAPETICFAAA